MVTAECVTRLLTKENLIAWLKTKPAATEYDYYKNDDCLIARYLRATLRVTKAQISVSPWDGAIYFGTPQVIRFDIPSALDGALRRSNRQGKHTYGTALRALRAKRTSA